jgi:hypothetical protein
MTAHSSPPPRRRDSDVLVCAVVGAADGRGDGLQPRSRPAADAAGLRDVRQSTHGRPGHDASVWLPPGHDPGAHDDSSPHRTARSLPTPATGRLETRQLQSCQRLSCIERSRSICTLSPSENVILKLVISRRSGSGGFPDTPWRVALAGGVCLFPNACQNSRTIASNSLTYASLFMNLRDSPGAPCK